MPTRQLTATMPDGTLLNQTLHYELLGPATGAPLLLMHGWMEVGRDLLALANGLTGAGYRVILPDLPGYGRSVPPFRAFTPDFYHRDARLIAALLQTPEQVGLAENSHRVHVLGFSDGGEVALLLGVDYPELCRSVVAWGAVGHYPPSLGEYVRHEMTPVTITPALLARHRGQAVERWQEAWQAAFLAIVEAGGDVSLSRAAQITFPLLLMVGDRDRLNPVACAQRVVQAAGPRAALRVFADCGHAIHELAPDAFLQAVLAFLAAVP